VGKRRLEAALRESSSANSNLEVDVRWRPFQLNENLPKGKGFNKLKYYEEKFGAGMVSNMVPKMKQVGDSVNIAFSYGGHVGNTLDSHRLIWKARELGGTELQNQMVESLFKAYFEEEQSLGEREVLLKCADQAGMPGDKVKHFLDSSEGIREVRNEEIEYRTKWRCRGVPLFIINNQHTLSGAQPAEAFLEVFEELGDE